MQTVRRNLWSLTCLLACACAGCQDHTTTSPDPAVTPAAAVEKGGRAKEAQILTLSPGAAERLRSMRVNGNLKTNAIVRIGVVEGNFFRLKNGGEKRYRYTLLLDDDPKDLDSYYQMESQGFTIQVPKSSAPLLQGTEVIWIEAGGRGGFKFQNPNQLTEDEASKFVPVPDLKPSKSPASVESSSVRTPTPLDQSPSEKNGRQEQ